jgi:hypothetical protein
MPGFLPFSARKAAAFLWLASPTELSSPRMLSRSAALGATPLASASCTPAASRTVLISSAVTPLLRSCWPIDTPIL